MPNPDQQSQAVATHYRKKPVVIEAVQYNGRNFSAVLALGGDRDVSEAYTGGLTIHTLEGDHRAAPGSWIIKGIQGELYPCDPDIFEATYEAVTPRSQAVDEPPVVTPRFTLAQAKVLRGALRKDLAEMSLLPEATANEPYRQLYKDALCGLGELEAVIEAAEAELDKKTGGSDD